MAVQSPSADIPSPGIVSDFSSAARSSSLRPNSKLSNFPELPLSALTENSRPHISSPSNMISASLALPGLLPGREINHDIGYELYKLINNPSSMKAVQEAPAATTASLSSSNEAFGSFGKFPREIRDKIYGYLLINPILGESQTGCKKWHPEIRSWKFVKYQLSTSIIFTCSSISKEALKVLYESNEFCLSCFNRDEGPWPGSYRLQTPILRFRPADSRYKWEDYIMRDRGAFVALRRVRRWKILISTLDKPFLHDYREPMLSSRALIDLCKIMDISRPKSIEVLVIPKNMEGIEGHFQCTFRNIHEALLPFRLLRNMPQGALRFRDAKKLEVNPQFIDTQVDPWSGIPVGPITTQLPNSVSLGELIHLAESKKPFEYATDMFAGLLRYAQVFERFEPFRLEMGKGQSYRLPRETVSSRYRYYFHDGFKNPFKYGREHPVERALWEAEAASDSEDLTAFKGFVPLSSPTSSPNTNGSCRYTRSLFARAFVRDAPWNNQIEIKKQHRQFARHYWDHNREGALADMAKALDRDDSHYFGHFFRTGFRDMEDQFLKMRQARKALFEFDAMGEHGVEVDLELEGDDTAVSLSVQHSCQLYEDDDW